MAATDTLCFADFDPVTGPPGPPDGFFLPDPGVITNEVDPGYVNGCRMTFGGSGFPPVVFQGVRNGNFLHLAFLCRLDLSFDAEDVAVVALRPSKAVTDQSTARRIDIFPVYEGVGADEKIATGGPAGTPDDVPAGTPSGAIYNIRTNHTPQRKGFWRGQTGAPPWVAYTPSNPAAFDAKVRSWKPPVPGQTTSTGTQTLSTSSFTLNVASTSAFAASGLFQVSGRIITYSGKTPTSFTGCVALVSGISVPAGTPVSIPEAAWSIELKLPINIATGGTDWINLADGFGLYFNVIRVGKTAASGPTPSQTWYSTQFRFPAAVATNFLTGILNDTLNIDPNWYGTGLIPALQSPPGSNRGQGVRFHNDEFSVGRRELGASTLILGHQISGTVNNELVALVDNTSPTDTAANVTAEFRFANWGLGAGSFTAWAKPSGLAPNPTTPVTVTAGDVNKVLKADWPAASVPAAYAPPKDHQCVWVQLHSTSAVNFVQSSTRRNMDFINLSEFERPAEISGVGYLAPTSGSDHDFLLFTHARKIVTPRFDPRRNIESVVVGDGSSSGSDEVHYLWITEGYRRTGQTLAIGTKTTEVLDESPGAFGFIARHEGVDDLLTWTLTGPGLHHGGGGVYSLKVPDGGSVTINTKLKAAPLAPVSKLPWWLWLLLILLLLLLINLLT